MEFEKLVKKRYSVRKFKKEQIPKEDLDKILSMNLYSPTAKNAQPQRIYVLSTEESLTKIRKLTPMTYNAPIVLLVCADTDNCWKSKLEENVNSAEVDAAIACTHMMLEATNLGIGSVWVRYFNSKEVQNAFDLPKNIKPVCLLPLGYEADDSVPMELHSKTKQLDEMIKYI